ncbi:hypothetical protein [Campylobacter suis]|uniref:NADH dehydrogenase subunit 6 n=1 Tax=Campylobacter suis TaxID=2790657 RepID=A0ABM8Q615_9BACT|nr:hypothetical protein [Campylobacter suis]CAD7288223.1 hypothetical protein LMG8286_01199 [Campylobacter suis]
MQVINSFFSIIGCIFCLFVCAVDLFVMAIIYIVIFGTFGIFIYALITSLFATS